MNSVSESRVEGLCETAGPPALEDAELARRFQTLAAEWKAGRGYTSSISKMSMHHAYQQIIALGPRVIPLVLGELERETDHWFWALKMLTGVDPVPQEARANIVEMAKYWVLWGRQQGYRW